MNTLSDLFELRLATEADAEEVLRIYECEEFDGKISVLYTRRPNPYLSLLKEGEKVIMPVIYDRETKQICGVGCCVIRVAYIDGAVKRTGYLTGLKILPEYRKRIPYIAQIYQFLYDQTKPFVDYYYTTILIENVTVQKMLEKKRKNMPAYDLKGIYTVYCFKTGKKTVSKPYVLEQSSSVEQGNPIKRGNLVERGNAIEQDNLIEPDKTIDLEAFYKRYGKDWELFSPDFSLEPCEGKTVYTLRTQEGEILAACTIWNQQEHKQYIVTRYGGYYKLLQYLPLNFIGYPKLPKCNKTVNYACLHNLCVKNADVEITDYFIKKIAEHEKSYDFLMLGLFETHPFVPLMERIKHIKYQSKFYEIIWEKNEQSYKVDYSKIYIDVGLL